MSYYGEGELKKLTISKLIKKQITTEEGCIQEQILAYCIKPQ